MNKIPVRSRSSAKLPANWCSRPLLCPFVLAALAILAGACSLLHPAKDTSKYYILTATKVPPSAGALKQASRAYQVCIAPVGLSEYLKTSDIVVRKPTNQVILALYHRWIETLDAGIRRVLAEDLRNFPSIETVVTDQRAWPPSATYTVSIHVLACEGVLEANQSHARFAAQWQISSPEAHRGVLDQGVFRAEQAVWNGRDYNDLARQLSHAVEDLSEVLVAALSHHSARPATGSGPSSPPFIGGP